MCEKGGGGGVANHNSDWLIEGSYTVQGNNFMVFFSVLHGVFLVIMWCSTIVALPQSDNCIDTCRRTLYNGRDCCGMFTDMILLFLSTVKKNISCYRYYLNLLLSSIPLGENPAIM